MFVVHEFVCDPIIGLVILAIEVNLVFNIKTFMSLTCLGLVRLRSLNFFKFYCNKNSEVKNKDIQ